MSSDKRGGKSKSRGDKMAADENICTYRDFSSLTPEAAAALFQSSGNVGPAVAMGLPHGKLTDSSKQQYGFAVKLHYLIGELESSAEDAVIGWQPHGRCFLVRDRDKFVETVLPNWFQQNSFPSFQRQLNLYGFKRISSGVDKGGYYHELFLRMKPDLARYIQRTKKKGTGPRKPDNPNAEPDFYSMPFLPHHRSDGQDLELAQQQAQLQSMGPFPSMFGQGFDPLEQMQQSNLYNFNAASQSSMQAMRAAQQGLMAGNFAMGAAQYGGGMGNSPLMQPLNNAGIGHLAGLPRRWMPQMGNFGDMGSFGGADPSMFQPLPASMNAAWNGTGGLAPNGQYQDGGRLDHSPMAAMENNVQQHKNLQQPNGQNP